MCNICWIWITNKFGIGHLIVRFIAVGVTFATMQVNIKCVLK